MYSPSKGFRSYPEFGIKRELPRELGFPLNSLANPAGIPEPEGYRNIIGYWKDGTPIFEADECLMGRSWNAVVRGLRKLHDTGSVISAENKLSRNDQKAAKHRVRTMVSLRVKRMMKLDPSLDPMVAISQAEESFANLVVSTEAKGRPSYQYATPRFDAHNLKYVLQDNTKTRVIAKISGNLEAKKYLASK